MEVYLLDAKFDTVAIIDDFTSLIWRRRYNTVGDFELHCSPQYYKTLSGCSYVYIELLKISKLMILHALLKGGF